MSSARRYLPCDVEIPAVVLLDGNNIAEQVAWFEPESGVYGEYDDPPEQEADGRWRIIERQIGAADFSQVVLR